MDHLHLPVIVTLVLAVISFQGVTSQRGRTAPCDASRACYPATGDLLIGRENRLYASSTCGMRRAERYCIVSHLEDRKKCFVCDSRHQYTPGLHQMSHRIENIVSQFRSDWKRQWWQAENGEESVYIQLDLEAEFHFTHLVMRFKTFRPSAMIVERSHDFGKTWQVYRYFAYDCAEAFPGIATGPVRRITDIICESRYSDVAPSTEGEVIFRALPPSIEIEDPYSEKVQDLLKMTNLRINFTSLHTLGDDKLDSRVEVNEKYYYALYDMVVRGSCSCYGHASRCVPLPGQANNPQMVHGRCECTHNTKGLNCELCEDFYNDLPWRPAHGRETNACKKCECNNHATRCHFDPAIYEATGRVSGGVCDECQHNTMGRNCEQCKPFFFQDPDRDIRDPYVCQPCNCNPVGSEHNGECESHTDPENDLVAGRCICKRFVEGQQCDTCRAGYWNLRADNIDGCEPCSCDTLGTVGNYGCDKYTGECRCKRFVTGRNCDQCLPGYWGISNEVDGCKPCDCDIGGSYNNKCDQQTGQCSCRSNIIGRRCDQPSPGFFSTDLDFLRYEAEFATGSDSVRAVIREPQPGRPITWTGPGFMRVAEGDSLEFIIDDIPTSMEYDIIIRYEPQMPERWEDVRLIIERPGPINQQGPCANSIPQDDFKSASLPQGSRYYVVFPSSCLEAGISYKLRLEFMRYKGDRPTPEASVLIDSIVLMPSPNSISIFQGPGTPARMREEFERYMCRELQMSLVRPELPDVCKKYIFSISASIQDMALDCQCDPTGSVSGVCDPQGGQCECKFNVIGRRCDQCAPGTYGFGPQGCQACNCNAVGSRDNFCEVENGQCYCMPGVTGRQCDRCQRGYWSFPNCRMCQCNGRADECEDQTGGCIQCRDNTGGADCSRCADGYYGDPRPGSTIGCRPCMCPGGAGSGFQHGDTCDMDIYTNRVTCNCEMGYRGDNCNQCAENYFGNPMVPGGSCEECFCNGNIDTGVPGSCDPNTGECRLCLYNTEGFSCERCKAGFYGDATLHNCQKCVCNLLGSDRSQPDCDRVTGQCPCLPNVIGLQCDRCAPNHWKIASGLGCTTCDCDPEGSLSPQCNEFDGRCQCKPGRGGRDCSECEDFYWGDPTIRCYPCNCDGQGSATRQCDRRTGQCQCIEGVAGDKCDHCARGTTGELPFCEPCGECFDNWDRIVMDLKNQTTYLVDLASDIKVGGAGPGAFDDEFREMQDKLDEVKKILDGTNVTAQDIDDLRLRLDRIRKNLTDSDTEVEQLNDEIEDTADRIETANNRISAIKDGVDELKAEAEQLKKNATNIREQDVAGAYKSVEDSLAKSRAAQSKVDDTTDTVARSEYTRERMDDLIDRNLDEFNRQYEENEKALDEVEDAADAINDKIVDLNEMVCGGRGDPCDDICGGAGCNKCGGGLSCADSAVSKANNGLDLSRDSEEILNEKKAAIEDLLNKLQMASDDANMAKADAQMAFDRALEAKNESEGARADIQDLLVRITDFLQEKGARPSDIRAVAEEVLGMSISLTPEEIQDLARQINRTIEGLTQIDDILEDTKEDLDRVQRLRDRANKAQEDADSVLDTAQRVLEALKEAREAQNGARDSIKMAGDDISDAEGDLTQIEAETAESSQKSNETLHRVYDLQDRLDELKKKYTENERNVKNAEDEAVKAEMLAEQAEQDAVTLSVKYQEASQQLETKYNETRTVKQRADALRDRASQLFQDTYRKLQNLRTMEAQFDQHAVILGKLDLQIADLNARMMALLSSIQWIARFHRSC